jgi:hypothetical protein
MKFQYVCDGQYVYIINFLFSKGCIELVMPHIFDMSSLVWVSELSDTFQQMDQFEFLLLIFENVAIVIVYPTVNYTLFVNIWMCTTEEMKYLFLGQEMFWIWVWKGHGKDYSEVLSHSVIFFYSLVFPIDFWA